jgi:hypothetical protein
MQFSLFQIYSDCDQLGIQMGLKLGRVRSSETRKIIQMMLNNYKKRHTKNIQMCSKIVQKEGPSCFFCGCSGFRPSMVSRASLGRLPGPKARQNGGPDMHSLLFWGPCVHFLWGHFRLFRVFHEQQMNSTGCSVYGGLSLG